MVLWCEPVCELCNGVRCCAMLWYVLQWCELYVVVFLTIELYDSNDIVFCECIADMGGSLLLLDLCVQFCCCVEEEVCSLLGSVFCVFGNVVGTLAKSGMYMMYIGVVSI